MKTFEEYLRNAEELASRQIQGLRQSGMRLLVSQENQIRESFQIAAVEAYHQVQKARHSPLPPIILEP